MKKYSFHVQGTHCKACKMLIEDILVEQKEITHASVNLNNRIVEIEGALNVDPEEFVKKLNPLLKEHGYALSTESNVAQKDLTPFYTAVPLGLLVLFLFFLLQKSGVIYFGFEGGLTPWTALLVGLIASVSTCLAVVGGLILSLSAKISQDVSNFRPFLFFHTGRVFAFALLGGVLGAIGSAISINHSITALLGLLAAFVMIILGINLLDILHITKRLQITLPETFFKKVSKIEQGIWAPLLVGAATFFSSMRVYSIYANCLTGKQFMVSRCYNYAYVRFRDSANVVINFIQFLQIL